MEFLRRAGVIGDIHGDAGRLKIALQYLQSLGDLDALLSVGDVVNLDADTEACCRLLQEARVTAVRGNHDRWFLQNLAFYVAEDDRPNAVSLRSRAFIASLPPARDIETVAGRLLLCHGLGEDDMSGVYPSDERASPQAALALWKLQMKGSYRWIVNGHTHRRMVREIDGMTIVNAGTVCCDPRSGFCLIDFEKQVVQFFDLDQDLAVHIGDTVNLLEESLLEP